jgi:hypothetical protein
MATAPHFFLTMGYLVSVYKLDCSPSPSSPTLKGGAYLNPLYHEGCRGVLPSPLAGEGEGVLQFINRHYLNRPNGVTINRNKFTRNICLPDIMSL